MILPRRIRILPLLAIVPLAACEGGAQWLHGPAAAAAYAAPLASDTSVVTVRRVWSLPRGHPSGIRLYSSTIMPDGAGLAATDWSTADLAVFDLRSKESTRLLLNTEPGDRGSGRMPIASPDGGQIAFLWFARLDPRAQLRVVDLATREPRTLLARDTNMVGWLAPVAWTPAGDSVFAWLFPPPPQDGDVEIVLIPVAGGAPRLVHTIPRQAVRMLLSNDNEWRMGLSPDGRWLLYVHELSRAQQMRSDIYVIDVRGGGARPLVEHPALDLLVGWLPGTDVVLFSSDRSGTRDLWSVRVVNGRASDESRLVRTGFFNSKAVGFGGGALFYSVETGSTGPAIINVDPGSGAPLGSASPPLAGLGSSSHWGVAWSPDGQTLAALTRERGLRTVTLHSMATGARRVFRLDHEVNVWRTQWAADGKSLFLRVAERGPSTNPGHFLRLDLVTGATTRLFAATDPGSPDLDFHATPDGRSLVLRRRRTLDDERAEITLMLRSLEDGSERELYRSSGLIMEFSTSVDGTQLAFVQHVENEADSLFVLSLDGSRPSRSVASWDHPVSLLGWLPGGNTLLGARLTGDGTGEEIVRIGLDGSTTVVGVLPYRGGPGYRSMLMLSPAGNRLVQFVYNTGEELWRMDGLHELFAREAAGRR
jgi:Tol biopolymer transport system component